MESGKLSCEAHAQFASFSFKGHSAFNVEVLETLGQTLQQMEEGSDSGNVGNFARKLQDGSIHLRLVTASLLE